MSFSKATSSIFLFQHIDHSLEKQQFRLKDCTKKHQQFIYPGHLYSQKKTVKCVKEIYSVVVNHVCLSTYSWELSSNGVSRNSN